MAATTIGFIGGGQMARALASGFVVAGLVDPVDVGVADVVGAAAEGFVEQIPGAVICDSNAQVVSRSDTVFLAVKPQSVPQVAAGLSGRLGDDTLLVSICAGVTIETLQTHFHANRIVRVMPNTPCLVGAGASAFCLGGNASDQDAAIVRDLLASIGVVVRVDESQLDGVTGLSGSGPAFVYQVIEALSDAGVRVGLPRDVAQLLATQTVFGAAKMVADTGDHPAVLKDRVTSPGGTTIAGLQALESGGLRAALIDAVSAATRRSIELGK